MISTFFEKSDHLNFDFYILNVNSSLRTFSQEENANLHVLQSSHFQLEFIHSSKSTEECQSDGPHKHSISHQKYIPRK